MVQNLEIHEDSGLPNELVYRLYNEAKKLRGLALLIATRGETEAEHLDIEDRNAGIALIVEDIAEAVRKTANEIESQNSDFCRG